VSVDTLVNCAGGPDSVEVFFRGSVEEVWDRVIAVNLKGVRNCTRAVINHMIDRRYGKIVNIASLAGVVGGYSKVDYSAAKAGVIGFTMALAKEVAGFGINVNCISPGPIQTRALLIHPEYVEQGARMTGLGRVGKPEEVAALAVFLASDEAGFITGQNYPICGIKNLGA
jgi:NAD(P)-dependent dehydrogenase (short-subunit alcohol dehydrogenase family)